MQKQKMVTIFSEATFKKNPGISAWASMLKYKRNVAETTGSETASTNKRGELLGVINALKKLKEPCDVTVYTTSGYVYTGVTQYMQTWAKNGWTRSKGRKLANVELWQNMYALTKKHNVKVMLLRNRNVNKDTCRLITIAKKVILETIQKMKSALAKSALAMAVESQY